MIGNAIKRKTHRIRRAFGDYQCGFNDIEMMLSRRVNVKRVQLRIPFWANTAKKLTFGDFEGFGSNIHVFSLFQCIQVLYRNIDLLSIQVLFLCNKCNTHSFEIAIAGTKANTSKMIHIRNLY